MARKKHFVLSLLITFLMIFIAQNAIAGEDWQEKQKQMFAEASVKPGDIINKTNWEKAKGLLPEQILDTVKNGDWILEIGEFEYDHDYTDAYYELSARNEGKYTLGDKKEVLDISTGKYPLVLMGMPFPNIDMKNDPDGATKFMHNQNQAVHMNTSQNGLDYPKDGNLQWIGRKSGYERGVGFLSERVFWWNRHSGPIPNPRKYKTTTMQQVTFPYDMNGVANLFIRHLDGRPDSVYAYVPAIRRVKRLSGANRSDPQMGSDMTMDDSSGFSGHIESMKWSFVEEKIMLKPLWKADAKSPRKLKPTTYGAQRWISTGSCRAGYETEGWTGAPWAYTNLVWIPRVMYVFKMEPLDPYYVYGVHEMYLDKLTTMSAFVIKYTKAGEFWKSVTSAMGPVQWSNGEKWFSMDGPMSIVDHKTDHASILDIDDNPQDYDTPKIKPSSHTPMGLRTYSK